jgi:hypothetical protein
VIFEAEGIDELCGKVMLDMQELCRKMILWMILWETTSWNHVL